MPDSISVHVNRSEHGEIEVNRPSIETDRAFELRVHNHGEPVHLHVKASDELAGTLAIGRTNPYLEAGATMAVPITVGGHTGPLSGTVSIETGFGANAAAVGVTLTGGVGDDQRVDVDERLATPATDDTAADQQVDRLLDEIGLESLALGGLVALALLVGVATAAMIEGPVGILGVLVVLGGVAAALLLLVRDPADRGGPSE